MHLEQLQVSDGVEIYNMLQRIGANENEFKNTAHGLTFEEYKKWLHEQWLWSQGNGLPKGYVPQTVYWFYDSTVPVGIGKIRHSLNEDSRRIGGNIGYAVDPIYRGKGYATILLRELLIKARELKISEILLTVEKYNPASRKVIEKNNGVLIGENDKRWFFTFD